MAERIFGVSVVNSDGKAVAVRYLGEQHVREDLGRIPTLQDWLMNLKSEPWMYGRKLELEKEPGQLRSCLSDLDLTVAGRQQRGTDKSLSMPPSSREASLGSLG